MHEGSTIDGKYLLARQLGRGGMGAVYEAQNLGTLKRCAVKLILDKHLDDERHRVRFFREARASSVVDSEHIVQIFDCGTDETEDVPYIVMEFLDGESLDALVKRVGPLDPQIAARIALQAAAGLARAHAAGIVHRDIKPANLFLAKSDLGDITVKVLDFGLAKATRDADSHASLTQSGAMVGTPSYMSPEQALGEKGIEAATDVWSLGVVLFEMLTGTLPFSGATSLAVVIKIAQDEIPLLQERAPWVPPELAEIVHRCMSRTREQRFLDATSLRDALAAFAGDSRLTAQMLADAAASGRSRAMPKAPIEDSVRGTASRSRARVLVGGGVALGLLAAGAIAIPFALSGDPPAPPAAALPTTIVVREPAPALPPAPPPPAPAAPTPYEARLRVGPANVTVEIDGAPATVENGSVLVRGFAGDGRIVVLRDAKRSLRQEVIVRSNGTLTPSRLELSEAGIQQARVDAKSVAAAKAHEAAKRVTPSAPPAIDAGAVGQPPPPPPTPPTAIDAAAPAASDAGAPVVVDAAPPASSPSDAASLPKKVIKLLPTAPTIRKLP